MFGVFVLEGGGCEGAGGGELCTEMGKGTETEEG